MVQVTGIPQNPSKGISFLLASLVAISLNDMLIKLLSGGYPLHQLVFFRSGIGIFFSLAIVQLEGGFRILKTDQPWLHLLRGLLIVMANITYFAALAALPLADATALFFVAPLFITLLSIPILGERVGPFRLGAVFCGFLGVLVMQRLWEGRDTLDVSRWVLLLPILSAFGYALFQVLARKLGSQAKASAMAIYVQSSFLVFSLMFYLVAGDGRFAEGSQDPSLSFLLRAWVWPHGSDWWVLVGLGLNSAVIGYSLSQAYRLTDAATLAPYEYVGLPLAIIWGLLIFGDFPVWEVWLGMAMIIGSGVFVFFRERRLAARR